MYLTAVKLTRVFFWLALTTGLLALLLPQLVPFQLPLALAVGCGILFLYALFHVRTARRPGLRCPSCGWVPFALNAWKCKECRFVWDAFSTEGICPRCAHEHEEIACVRCRRIASLHRWRS